MAWVRIHDGAMTHLKIIRLSDAAFRLWVHGLSYCQMNLTDGQIPQQALPLIGARRRAVVELVSAQLWERTDQGIAVHDYLDWNDGREDIQRKRAAAKTRYQRWQQHQRDNGAANARSNALATPPIHHTTDESQRETRRAHRGLAFAGSRLQVPTFLHEEFTRELGHRGPDFELSGWYHRLDEELQRSGESIDTIPWLRARFRRDADLPHPARQRGASSPSPGTRREAEKVRKAHGHCFHDPPCDTYADCLEEIVLAMGTARERVTG